MPADHAALIAEAEGLCAKLARDEAHCHDYGTSIDIELAFAKGARTLIPELLAALRQRPGREDTRPNPARVTPLAEFEAEFLRSERDRLAARVAELEARLARLAAGVRAADNVKACMENLGGDANTADLLVFYCLAKEANDQYDAARAALTEADLA